MNWLTHNLAETLFIIGLIILIIEVTVLSFSTIILFMLGAATIITSITMYMGVISANILDATLMIAIVTAVLALILWKPFKQLQNTQNDKAVSSDLVGFTFILSEELSPGKDVSYKYSGIQWRLVSAQTIAAQTKVKVVAVNVGEWEVIALN